MNDTSSGQKPEQPKANTPAPAGAAANPPVAPAAAKPAPKTQTAAEVLELPVVPLSEDRWQLKEHRNPGHWICVPAGTTLEHIQQPSFWANVAKKLAGNSSSAAGVTVEVHWDDFSQFAEVYVLSNGRNWASVSLLRHQKLAKAALPQQANDYSVAFNGPVDRVRITRLSDKAVIRAGFASEREAQRWLDEYLQKLAA